MALLITKYLITALIVVAVSEIAKRFDKIGALIASLPIVAILVMVWLWADGQPREKIASYAQYTFWFVIPTLPMFLVIPWSLNRGLSFWGSLGIGSFVSILCLVIAALVLKKFGIDLIP